MASLCCAEKLQKKKKFFREKKAKATLGTRQFDKCVILDMTKNLPRNLKKEVEQWHSWHIDSRCTTRISGLPIFYQMKSTKMKLTKWMTFVKDEHMFKSFQVVQLNFIWVIKSPQHHGLCCNPWRLCFTNRSLSPLLPPSLYPLCPRSMWSSSSSVWTLFSSVFTLHSLFAE